MEMTEDSEKFILPFSGVFSVLARTGDTFPGSEIPAISNGRAELGSQPTSGQKLKKPNQPPSFS
jgi:hypothetical protein